MLRKFKTSHGLLAGYASMEEAVHIEPADQGIDAPNDILFGDAAPQELPTEAKDILVYFTEDKAKEIAEGGPELAMESFWNLIADIESVRTSVRSEGGVSQSLALECERLLPGFLTDDYPLNAFSKIPTRTNLSYTVETFDVKTGAIIGAIIAIILGIAKLMFGGDSGSSGSTNGAAGKVEDKHEKLIDNAAKSEQAIEAAKEKAGLNAGDARDATTGHYLPKGIPKGHPLEQEVARLNQHVTDGLNGLQSFALGMAGIPDTAASKFWVAVGKGKYTATVIALSDCFDTMSREFSNNQPGANGYTPEQIASIDVAYKLCLRKIKPLGLYANANFDLAAVESSTHAADDFFKSNPTKVWLEAFRELKSTKIATGYRELLKESIISNFWSPNAFFWNDFLESVDDGDRRKEIHLQMRKNISIVIPQMEAAFKKAWAPAAADAASTGSEAAEKTIKYALKLCEYILEVLRNLSHIFNDLIDAVKSTREQIIVDVGTIARAKKFEADAASKPS